MTRKSTAQLTLWLVLWIVLVLIASPLMAEETANVRSSRSISFDALSDLDRVSRDDRLKQAEIDNNIPVIKTNITTDALAIAAQIDSKNYSYVSDTVIYDATTDLISDFNYDGFYHRFSVTIDADTVYDTAYVYVELYLSYEGGPWNHYATSDNYHIHGDSETDKFVIETELAEGFPTGYYDVRIKLYDADHDTWLDTYDSHDDASLIALPLEDSYLDDEYPQVIYPVETEVIVAGHGHGAISWWLLTLPALLLTTRRFSKKH